MYNDEEALQAVCAEIKRKQSLKTSIQQASYIRDEEQISDLL